MSVPKKNIIGGRLKQARTTLGVTQDQLSAKLARAGVQIDRAGISKIENASRCVCDFELKAIAKALSTNVSNLLEG